MKKETLITAVIVVVCFITGVFLSDYIRSSGQPGTQQEQIPSVPQINTEDLLGKPLPVFSLIDMSGKSRNVSEWQGKVLVINFWATWCPPCLEEIPRFVFLQDKYGHQGLQFIGISLESAEDIQSFAFEFDINYPLLVGEQDVIKLAGKLGNRIGGLPYTVIIDRSGNINFIKKGPLSISETEQLVVSLL